MLDTTGHDMMHFCRRLGRRFFLRRRERERAHGALQRTTVVRASTTVMSGPCPALPLLVAPSICPCSSGLETRAMHCQQLGSASRSSPVVSGDRWMRGAHASARGQPQPAGWPCMRLWRVTTTLACIHTWSSRVLFRMELIETDCDRVVPLCQSSLSLALLEPVFRAIACFSSPSHACMRV